MTVQWAPVRISVGDQRPQNLGRVCLPGGRANVAAVAEFLRALADRMEQDVKSMPVHERRHKP